MNTPQTKTQISFPESTEYFIPPIKGVFEIKVAVEGYLPSGEFFEITPEHKKVPMELSFNKSTGEKTGLSGNMISFNGKVLSQDSFISVYLKTGISTVTLLGWFTGVEWVFPCSMHERLFWQLIKLNPSARAAFKQVFNLREQPQELIPAMSYGTSIKVRAIKKQFKRWKLMPLVKQPVDWFKA